MQSKISQSKLWLNCILLSLITSLTFAADINTPQQIFQTPKTITQAPNLSLFDLKNREQRLSRYAGKVILLHFWATWCSSCLLELPQLQTLWEKLRDKGLVVIAIAADNRKSVEAFVKAKQFTFPVWIDQYGSGLRAYSVKGFPTTSLIGRTGNLEGMALGPRDWTNSYIFKMIEVILAKDVKI
jgi:peroxiredoxin